MIMWSGDFEKRGFKMMNIVENSLRDIEEEIEMLTEILGETETQHLSECALYGDSWPGAQIQIENMKERLAFLNLLRPSMLLDFETIDDDIPY